MRKEEDQTRVDHYDAAHEVFGHRDFVFLCWVTITGAVVMLSAGVLTGGISAMVGGGIVAGVFAGLLLLLPRLGLRLVKNLAIIVLWLTTLWIFYRGQGIRDAAILLFPALFLFSSLTFDRRYYWLVVGTSVLAVAFMGIAEEAGWIVRNYSQFSLGTDLYGAVVILLVVAFFIDVYLSNLNRTIHSLRLSKQSIAKADRTKEEFLTLITHELRSPLNPILGFANLLREDITDDEQRGYLDEISNASNELLELIDDVLVYSRLADGTVALEPQKVLVCDLCDELAGFLNPLAETKGLGLELDCTHCSSNGHDPASVVIDHARTFQILKQLGTSAVRFTNTGKLIVSVDGDSSVDDRAACRFTISNTGIILPPGETESVFQPFSPINQLNGNENSVASGMGLGLATARQMARLLDGDLRCEPISSGGSKFILDIPILSND